MSHWWTEVEAVSVEVTVEVGRGDGKTGYFVRRFLALSPNANSTPKATTGNSNNAATALLKLVSLAYADQGTPGGMNARLRQSSAFQILASLKGEDRANLILSDLLSRKTIPSLLDRLTAEEAATSEAALNEEKKEWEQTFKEHPEWLRFQDKLNPIMVRRVYLKTLKAGLSEEGRDRIENMLEQERNQFLTLMRGDTSAMPHAARLDGQARSSGRTHR